MNRHTRYIHHHLPTCLPISQDTTVVLLPVSLPQLKDPINGIFREGLELAYDRALRPNHADELREMVQDPKSKTEIVFFLDAYDGRCACTI